MSIIVALTSVALLSAQAAAPAVSEAVPATAAATTSAVEAAPAAASMPGKIVMYRGSSIMGAAIGCPIRYKGNELVELGRGKYAEWSVPAGSYILSNKTASVDVNVPAGQTKYVRCQIKPGFMSGRADLQIVDQESFSEHQADFEKKDVTDPAI